MSLHSNTNTTVPTNPSQNENTSPKGIRDQNIQRGDREESHSSLAPEVSQKCLEIMQEFRTGNRDKASAILEIQDAIPHESSSDSQFRAAFGSYCRMLDNFERFRESAADHADRGENRGEPSGQHNEDTPPAVDNDESGQLITKSNKRCLSPEAYDDTSHPSKRKVDISSLPWLSETTNQPPEISPSLKETQSLLENYSRDLKWTKATLVNSFNCPQFPDSEWTNLLSGRAIDLDHILSGLFTVSHDVKKTEQIGDLEIAVGSAVPAKSVKTHFDWVMAWDPTVEATIYAFPHRESELKKYGKYILQMFSTLSVEAHPRIINFDKAVRVRVAQRRNLLLSDISEFQDLHMHWIQMFGGGSSSSSRPSQGKRGGFRSPDIRKREPCRRWNEGRCPNTNVACNYKHVCSKCRANNHTAPECPKV
jgi:hypothetical protein